MSYKYKRKRIKSIEDLDQEQLNLRKKARQIESDWLGLLNPQQLALDFALNFATNKLLGGNKEKPTNKKRSSLQLKTTASSGTTKNTPKSSRKLSGKINQLLTASKKQTKDKKRNKLLSKFIKWQLLGLGVLALSAFLKRNKRKKLEIIS